MGQFGRIPYLPFVTDFIIDQAGDSTVRLAAAGDTAALARLIERHYAPMARVAYAITGDAELARDATQAAWAIAWRRLASLRDETQVLAWLVAIAGNEARKIVQRRRPSVVVDLSRVVETATAGDPADGIDVVDLERALAALKPEDRMLLALRFRGGLDSAEIASHLGLSASGVRSRLSRLIERLRVELDR